jgi:four helix bundle protein
MSKSFRDLIVFQRALDLVVEVYSVTKTFPRAELYGLTSQLRRASVGVVSQIAEGQGRLTLGEWRQFLSQSRGSLFEVESQALIANRLEYLDDERLDQVLRNIHRTGRALAGLIQWVQRKERERNTARTRQPRDAATS